ncbi:unnamed protein product [Amoebophrya sp. A25]|nr:unnamed protein product [Amoebophrya sp. A25]|eukprot:GSA25T00006683001.1
MDRLHLYQYHHHPPRPRQFFLNSEGDEEAFVLFKVDQLQTSDSYQPGTLRLDGTLPGAWCHIIQCEITMSFWVQLYSIAAVNIFIKLYVRKAYFLQIGRDEQVVCTRLFTLLAFHIPQG